MPQGSVITRVYTSDAYLPLQNVAVVYTRSAENNKEELLSIQYTDSSGLTKPFYVETPTAEQSLSPNLAKQPYAQINIRATYPGFNSAFAKNVQIFPDVQTIQAFQLRPVTPDETGRSITIFELPQNL